MSSVNDADGLIALTCTFSCPEIHELIAARDEDTIAGLIRSAGGFDCNDAISDTVGCREANPEPEGFCADSVVAPVDSAAWRLNAANRLDGFNDTTHSLTFAAVDPIVVTMFPLPTTTILVEEVQRQDRMKDGLGTTMPCCT